MTETQKTKLVELARSLVGKPYKYGATPEEAALIANFAAGIVVAKLGTATLTKEELLETMRENE